MPQRPRTTLGIAASISTSASPGPAAAARSELAQEERDRDRERRGEHEGTERGDGGAEEEVAAPKTRGETGFQPTCVMNPRPNVEIDEPRPLDDLVGDQAERTVAPSAATPATTCRSRSPKRTRRPEKGRRVRAGVSSVLTIGRGLSALGVDLRDRLLVERRRHRPEAARSGAAARSVWPFVMAQLRNCLSVRCLAATLRHDHVRVRARSDRRSRTSCRRIRRSRASRPPPAWCRCRGGDDRLVAFGCTNWPAAVLHLEVLQVVRRARRRRRRSRSRRASARRRSATPELCLRRRPTGQFTAVPVPTCVFQVGLKLAR